jgi:hypothetical protein
MVFDGFLAISGLFYDGDPLEQFLSDKLLGEINNLAISLYTLLLRAYNYAISPGKSLHDQPVSALADDTSQVIGTGWMTGNSFTVWKNGQANLSDKF